MPVTHEPFVHIGQPPSRKKCPWYRSPWLFLAAPVAAVALFATGALGVYLVKPQLKEVTAAIDPPFAPQPFSVSGFLTLESGGFIWSSATDVCSGKDGYDDIHAGTQVVVSDASGTTIAIGELGTGLARRDPDNISRATECRFPFKVTGVPGGHEFYGLAIGRRGKLDFPRDRIAGPHELNLN